MPKPPARAAISPLSPVGVAAAAVLLLVLVAGLLNWTSIDMDNDPYYHLNAGRYIVNQHELPHDSFFSYLDPPRSWIDYYWLFQTLAYLVQRAVGDYGLVLLRGLAVLATLGLVAAVFESKRREQDQDRRAVSVLTVAFVALYALALLPRFASIRPHTTTLVAMTLCLFILECLRGKEWLLVIVTLTWMNFHGIAYPIMLLVVGAYVIEIGAGWINERRLWNGRERTALLWMLGAMAMMLVTPHGVALIALPFRSIAVASRYILEIRPVDPSTLFQWSVGAEGVAPQTALNVLRAVAGVAAALASVIVLAGAYSAFTYFRGQSELIRPYGAHGAPRGVARFLESAGEGGRILHNANLGGYLAWKLYPSFEITADMQTPFVFSNVDVLDSVKVFNNVVLLRRALAEYRQQYIVAPLGNFGFSRYVTDRAGFVPVFFDEISALYVNRAAMPEVARKHEILQLDLTRNLIDQIAEMDQDQARSAIVEIERMLELDPDGGLLHLLASIAYLRSGDPASAARHAEAAAEYRRALATVAREK